LIYLIPQFFTLSLFLFLFLISFYIFLSYDSMRLLLAYYKGLLSFYALSNIYHILFSNSVHSTYPYIFTSCTSITFLPPGLFISPCVWFDVNTLYFQLSFVLYYNVHSSLKRLSVTGCFGNSFITLNLHAEELCWNTECPQCVSVLFSVTMINAWLLSHLRQRSLPFRLFIPLFTNSPRFQSCIV